MFEKMMVATGGSPWSNNAVGVAVQLAAELNRELLIAHVLEDDPQYGPPDLDPTEPQVRKQMEETGHSILRQATERAKQAGIAYTTHLVWGSIPEQLVHIARTEDCDLIVMGTRHLTGDKRLMTGRICNAVVATSPCPVLVVPLVQ
jgi:nucleotide-binding universal stress UspA family protein